MRPFRLVSSVRGGPAVDVVRGARDAGGDIRCEQDGGQADVLDGADPLERGLLGELVHQLLERQAHLPGALRPGRHEDVGPHQSRADRVAGDAGRAGLFRDRLRQADQRVLAGHIRGDRGLAVLALDRGDVDDPPGFLREHVAQRLAAGPERRVQVPPDGVVPVLVGQVRHRRGLDQAAGVVDEDVDAAEPLDRAVHHRVDVFADGDVTLDEVASLVGVHLLERPLTLLGVPAVDDDLGALGEKGLADAPSDPGAPAGDYGHLAVELAHGRPPSDEAMFTRASVSGQRRLSASQADSPPSTGRSAPVMKLASSESRKQTGAATSSGSATRFCRLAWPNMTDPCSTLPARSIISGSVMPVRVRPGATVLTRISGATSRASCREKARIAPLAAPYGAMAACAASAATDAALTIAPAGRLRITGSTCRQNRNVPPTCTVIMRCQRSNDHSSIGPNSAWPAALNRQSTDPKCCATVSTQRPTESSSGTSTPR